ncbi:MAG: hypothetical protein Q8K99_02295 [Actinomycetota bacterium]|nr:hypothetical protein [Actinomycetota bacterium]
MSKNIKIAIAAAVIGVVLLCGCALCSTLLFSLGGDSTAEQEAVIPPPSGDPTRPADDSTNNPSTQPVPDEPTPQAEPNSELAKRTEEAALEAFGVDSFTELLGAEGMEGSLVPYISGFEVVGGDTVQVTVQLTRNDVAREELERTAFTIHSLTGEQVEDLNRVEVWTADRELYGVSNRRDVPLLNR